MKYVGEVTVTTTLVPETCYSCGVLFGLENDHEQELRRTHNQFYCPNGHSQYYTRKSDKDLLDEARRSLATERENYAKLSRSKQRLESRVAKGVCAFCKRSFQNVQRHVERKHPAKV